jgi:hypothetical protein
MKAREKFGRGFACLVAVCLWVTPLLARQAETEKPKPAGRQYPPAMDPIGDQQNPNQGPQALQPDNQALSSIQVPTLGTPEIRHSYWVPGLTYSNIVLSNSLNAAASTGWNTTSFVSGDVSLLEAWSHSAFSTNYSGGGFFSTDPIQGNGQYHQLAMAYQIDKKRWQLLFIDQFSYLPQTAFGFGGPTGLALPGISGALAVPLPGLESTYLPSQTIFTTTGPRYSNASAAQMTYAVSPRGSITVAGVYGALRFINPGNVDSDSVIINAGYDYALTRKDSIGLAYRFGAYHFPGSPQAVGDHVAQVIYGRKITGRLALRLAGGPELIRFRIPIGGSTQKTTGSLYAALTYAFARGDVALGYTHDVSGGSGVFTGSTIDQVNAAWNRRLTQAWSGSLSFGYAKNQPIVSPSGTTPPVFGAWLAGAGLKRPLGRTANLSLAYQAQIQRANIAICNTPTCGTSRTVNQVFLTFQWTTRPLVLR